MNSLNNNNDLTLKIPFSKTALDIQKKVRQPLSSRNIVHYNRKFLDHYKPNETFYLSQSIQKHLEHSGQMPIQSTGETYTKKIFNQVLLDLSWNSSRLEGNTYSLLETERLLFQEESAKNKNMMETQMILNHKTAIEFLVDMGKTLQFNAYTILNLHALLSHNLLGNPASCGRLRTVPVNIGQATYRPLAIPALIVECFHQILEKAHAIQAPFEQAFFIMVHLPYLQPFEDVNKRTARLGANIPLIKHHLSPLSFVDVPEHAYIDGILGIYEFNQIDLLKDLFIWAYEQSAGRYSIAQQFLGEPDPFRLRYHALISQVISAVILACFNKESADIFIQQQAKQHFSEDKKHEIRFVEVIETELNALHEGNIARYKIHWDDFKSWHKGWNSV